MAVTTFSTAASTDLIFSLDACNWALALRSEVSFFNSASFPAQMSRRFCNPPNSCSHVCDGAAENSLATANFWSKKVRASATAFCPAPAAASQAWIAPCTSTTTSTPLRKGNSASAAVCVTDSAFSTWSDDCAMRSAASRRSLDSLAIFAASSSFFSATARRSRMPVSSSLRKPCALLSLMSTNLAVALSLVCAEDVARSIFSMTSLVG
mmetsp:Transcript_64797/g.171508  ORF Transcript_64797/g.171508 Transcript_64797/m.171508 type:complete len:209 (-) Transcript_64797:2555-3181(-)